MGRPVIEAQYPLSFRKEEAEALGRHVKSHSSVELIGMKRVGISNFLRFFLFHKDIATSYLADNKKHLFVSVDLNDLVERDIYPFWTLTLKRIVDAVEQSNLDAEVKTSVDSLFLNSIQSQDLFLLIDNVRRAIMTLVQHDVSPTLFFLRFDRLQSVTNEAFFDNLKGLRDASDGRLTYVFTAYRGLDDLFPGARTSLSVLTQSVYLKPASKDDIRIIYEAYETRHESKLPESLENALFDIVGGNVQYLQLAMIILNEQQKSIENEEELFKILSEDERIVLQSEELWESLSADEKKVLLQVSKGEEVGKEERDHARYLWDTGIVHEANGKVALFNSLFTYFMEHKKEDESNQTIHLTKKEHVLFSLLQKHVGEICERDEIVDAVWPEYREFGVSDWAIDRLVARVRVKLRKQHSPYEVVTIRTRGYKLTMANTA